MIELKKDNAHKNKQQSDLMVLASQSWNNIHKSEKAKYEAKALQLKEDYNEKMVEYQKKLEEHDQTRGRKSQSKISNLIQTNLSKKSQSKSKLRSQNQTKEKEKPKEIIPKEEPKSDKEKEKKSFGKNKK